MQLRHSPKLYRVKLHTTDLALWSLISGNIEMRGKEGAKADDWRSIQWEKLESKSRNGVKGRSLEGYFELSILPEIKFGRSPGAAPEGAAEHHARCCTVFWSLIQTSLVCDWYKRW